MFLNYDINISKEIVKRLNITEKEEIIRILSRKARATESFETGLEIGWTTCSSLQVAFDN